jgi:hypothetical protein
MNPARGLRRHEPGIAKPPARLHDHRPLVANRKQRMRDQLVAPARVEITIEPIAEARRVGHRPARIDLVRQKLRRRAHDRR